MTTKHNRPAGANGRAATGTNDTNFLRQYTTDSMLVVLEGDGCRRCGGLLLFDRRRLIIYCILCESEVRQ